MSNFKEYLQKQFMGDEPQLLDDDLPDAFDEWLEELTQDELIDHADVFANEKKEK